MRANRHVAFGGVLLSLVLSGCLPSLKDNPPREAKKDVPSQFLASEAAAARSGENISQKSWEEFFAEPELRALIEAALANNQELNIRLQEIVIAYAEVQARKGEYLPKLSARAGAGVERVGKNTSQGVSDEAHELPENLGDFKFGLAGSWEIDVWRKLRNAADAAQLRYFAQIEGRNFLITELVAEIARSYYELIAIDNELEVLDKNIELQMDALEVVRLEKLAARVTELAVQRFEAEVLKNKSRRYELEQERVQLENRINFLVGRYPTKVARDPVRLKSPLPEALSAGLPADLLENRPDVRQAELELEAAKLDVKAAKANFYPSLSIDAEVGYRSFNAQHLVATPDSLIYNLAGNLSAPLLNRAGIAAEYRTANAEQLRAVYQYEKTVLQAFTDVINQLARMESLKKSYELEAQQVEKLTESVEISNVLFQSARADYMEVLMTRRDALDAELELIETKKRQLLTMVSLYQALGGGWRVQKK